MKSVVVTLAIFAVAILQTHATCQCTPIVTGEYRATAGINGVIDEILPETIEVGIAILEQCGEVGFEFLNFSATYSFDDGTNNIGFNTDFGLKDIINTTPTSAEDFFQLPFPLKPEIVAEPCFVIEERPIFDLGGNWSCIRSALAAAPIR